MRLAREIVFQAIMFAIFTSSSWRRNGRVAIMPNRIGLRGSWHLDINVFCVSVPVAVFLLTITEMNTSTGMTIPAWCYAAIQLMWITFVVFCIRHRPQGPPDAKAVGGAVMFAFVGIVVCAVAVLT